MASPSAQFSLTLRVEIDRVLGQLGRVTSAIGDAGGQIGAVDIVEQLEQKTIRELIVDAADAEHGNAIVAAVNEVPGALVLGMADRTFELHRGGKIFTGLKAPIRNPDDVSMASPPGIARVRLEIQADRHRDGEYPIKKNNVAVV